MKKINIVFDGKGGSTIEASGFTGGECLKATRDIEEALGKVGTRKDKPEMYAGGVKATVAN